MSDCTWSRCVFHAAVTLTRGSSVSFRYSPTRPASAPNASIDGSTSAAGSFANSAYTTSRPAVDKAPLNLVSISSIVPNFAASAVTSSSVPGSSGLASERGSAWANSGSFMSSGTSPARSFPS